MNNNKLFLLIPSLLLLVALIDGLPYGFFTLLRIIVCFSSAYTAYIAFKSKQEFWCWLLAGIAVLFNPISPIYLSREIWVVIDAITAGIMITALFGLKVKQ